LQLKLERTMKFIYFLSQKSNEIDADMESSTNNMASTIASGLSFGGLGGGALKPNNETPKNVFGSAAPNPFGGGLAAAANNGSTLQQPKLAFGGGILKTPTFTAAQGAQQPTPQASSLFSSGTSPATGLFGSPSPTAAPTQPAGGLFSTFKTPEKPVFGGAPAFGATTSAFGAGATFGAAPAFGSANLFGSAANTSAAPSFTSAPLFGSAATSR
jgi:hypothetical protein